MSEIPRIDPGRGGAGPALLGPALARQAATSTPVFLIGSGRSGTTLVQRILNSYPGVKIWGEHAGFLRETSKAFYRLMESPSMDEFVYRPHEERTGDRKDAVEREGRPTNWQAWYNWFDRDDLPGLFRAHLESIFLPDLLDETSIWGFKEIRYGRGDRVLEFLQTLYPHARFVFILRNGLNTVESQLTTFYGGESRWLAAKRVLQLRTLVSRAREWESQNRNLVDLHESGLDGSLIRYDELIEDPKVLEPLLEDLSLTLGPEQLEVIGLRKGRGTSSYGNTSVSDRWRRMGPVGLTVAEWIVGQLNAELGYEPPQGRRWVATLRRRLQPNGPKSAGIRSRR